MISVRRDVEEFWISVTHPPSSIEGVNGACSEIQYDEKKKSISLACTAGILTIFCATDPSEDLVKPTDLLSETGGKKKYSNA